MNQTFMKKASFNKQILFFLAGVLMIGFSIYLTNHYFQVKYPSGITGGSLCNINSFFNCDVTTLSPLSNIAGVPISVFGILVGCFVVFYFLFNNEDIEGTLYKVLAVNVIGCIILFLYSLVILHHLCPFCTFYYICSISAFYLLHKNSENRLLSMKHLAIYGVITLITAGSTWSYVSSIETKNAQKSAVLVKMYNELANMGNPTTPSPFRLASATEKFEDAPIQVSVFSDFQCPACNALNQVLPKLEEKYHGKINIQYFFYPLDHNCNANINRPLHPLACKAAYISSCVPKDKFKSVHDKIFENQRGLSDSWLNDLAKELGVTECANKAETKTQVVNMINQADTFSVRSTPTMLLNGVKIEGVRPPNDYMAIMDHLLKKSWKIINGKKASRHSKI